ncbi:MAG: hypothetical protein JEY96_19725 [Bacteroidales bacterium]|nr:hypothetical protein [Bacteroidales bacterium]
MKFLLFERKLSLRLVKLLGLFLGIVLFFSCNMEKVENKMKENRECQRQVLNIDTYNKLSLNRISIVDSLIYEMKRRDSLLTVVVFNDTVLAKDNLIPIKITTSQLDTFIERTINETSCSKYIHEKKQLKNILISIKQSEIKCDNYLAKINYLTKKDSAYREELGMDYVPFEILFKAKVSNPDTTFLKFDCAKKLDKKINKLLMQTYIITKTQDEIIEYLKSIKNSL